MSKVDAMRALREARYSRTSGPAKTAAAQPVGRPTAVGSSGLCGHRNIGGKHCSRPSGHSEKNHRYATSAPA